MGSSTDSAWCLLEAAEILHAHADGAFGSRLGAAIRHLFPGARYALDLFLPDATHVVETNLDFDDKTTELIRTRGAEIGLRDHPVCQKLLVRSVTLGRLSDYVNPRRFQNTELYQSIYRTVDLNYQIFGTVPVPVGAGAISIDRDRVDFSEADVRLLGHFVRQVQRAYATELRLRELSPRDAETELEFFDLLRSRAVTKRESSILYWLNREKRPAEIALILGISRRTVEAHLANVYRKLDVDNRAAALRELEEIRVRR